MRDFFEGFVIHEPLIKHQHGCLNIYVYQSEYAQFLKKLNAILKKLNRPLIF